MDIELLPRPADYTAEVLRPLTGADVALLREAPARAPSAIRRISDRHHCVARAIAAGVPPSQAAAFYGYSPSSISALKNDPTFKELLTVYRSEGDQLRRDLFEKLTGMTHDAIDIIQERMEDEDERKKIPLSTVMEVVKLGANRTGFGEASTVNQNVSVHTDMAERMAAARRKAKQIEGTARAVSE